MITKGCVFTNFHMPIDQVFKEVQTLSYLKPFEPKPSPNPLPSNYRVDNYCKYH